jgi:hypothetical protein
MILGCKKAAHQEAHCHSQNYNLGVQQSHSALGSSSSPSSSSSSPHHVSASPHLRIYLFVSVSPFVCSLNFLCFLLSPLSVTLFVSLSSLCPSLCFSLSLSLSVPLFASLFLSLCHSLCFSLSPFTFFLYLLIVVLLAIVSGHLHSSLCHLIVVVALM